MANKNIVVAPCGNKSHLFRESWLKQKDKKQFDLCLLFYHENINDPSLYDIADSFYHLKGFKYHMLHDLFTKLHPEWLTEYEYFYFLDDDIDIDTLEINDMFMHSRTVKSWISQASLSKDSFCSWPMFKQKKNSFCRFVGQIEVMAPLFDSNSLTKCLPSFIGNRSSWGVDSVWSAILGYPENRLVVFDTIIMRHTLPVGGGELYQKIGVNPQDEWNEITRKFNAKKQNYQEYGRWELVNKDNNRLKFYKYKTLEFVSIGQRLWKDYDIRSRIKNKKRQVLGIFGGFSKQ